MQRVFCHISRNLRNYSTKVTKAKMASSIRVRADPAITTVDTFEFNSLFSYELYDLIDIFNKYNYELRIAGGAVRDILMNIRPKDIDLATTATPEQMKSMFELENVRMINMKGEKHGTITPRINDKENFEVTTLRIDVVTDGRHAEVQFTTDWQVDASRRDLTINSMFLGLDGTVYDYFYGYEDLMKRRVVFVGEADARIKEDYLRILRYFRFYGRIAEVPNNHDEATLKAIADNIDGLQKISGERIWGELKKILQGSFAYDLTVELLKCGAAKYIGLPENPNLDELKRVFENRSEFPGDPMHSITFMAALLHTTEDAIKLHERLKLSAFERDLALFLTENRHSVDTTLKTLSDYQKICLLPNSKKEFVEELLKYFGKEETYAELKAWAIPTFPVNGNMLKANKCPQGKIMGKVMSALKLIWAEENFQPTADDLMNVHFPKILETVLSEQPEKEPQARKKQKTQK